MERQEVERHDVAFERFRMSKLLFEPQAARWVVFGNASSGKTTLSARLARMTGGAMLDLDIVAWEPSAVEPVRRLPAASEAEIDRFVEANPAWIIEGCYEDLIKYATRWNPAMLLLDPGVETCLARARARKFEAHKFASPAEQDAALGFLLHWIEDHYQNDGPMSAAAHRRLFESYHGSKIKLTSP